jgi:transketolase
MRLTTANRLLAMLQQEHDKLKAYNQTDFLGDHGKKEKEINALFQEWNLARGNHTLRQEILAKIDAAKRERDKLWKAWNKQTKNYEASIDEQHQLQWDIDDLRSALLSTTLRP